LKALQYLRIGICLALTWIWVFVWGIGLSVGFFIFGHRRDFLPRAVRILSHPILWICGIKVEMQNQAGLKAANPCIFVSNHQSGFDVPIFGQYCPYNLVWIAKKELGSMPFIGWVLKRTGNILIDRQKRETAFAQLGEAARKIADENRSVAVLPEGTRNRDSSSLLPFKRGPFHLAKAAAVPMIPVVCSSLHEVARFKNGKLGGRVILRVLPPVLPEGTPEQMAESLRDTMQAVYVELNEQLRKNS
jgi:1-acyl-sn-glycerol-3-phosphate acyltransferase